MPDFYFSIYYLDRRTRRWAPRSKTAAIFTRTANGRAIRRLEWAESNSSSAAENSAVFSLIFFLHFLGGTRHDSFLKTKQNGKILTDNECKKKLKLKYFLCQERKKISALCGKSTQANSFIAQMSFLFKCFLLCHILIPPFIGLNSRNNFMLSIIQEELEISFAVNFVNESVYIWRLSFFQ